MIKRGFTLTEVLVTLGIVGVISAFAIPSLVNEYNKQVYAKTLQVAISDFENAMQLMLYNEGKDSLFRTTAWEQAKLNGSLFLVRANKKGTAENFRRELNKVLPIEAISHAELKKKLSSGSSVIPSGVYFTTKKGIDYNIMITNTLYGILSKKTEKDMIKDGVMSKKYAAEIEIDVNGTKKPETYGLDVFSFDLSDDGRLVPAGSDEYLKVHSRESSYGGLTLRERCLKERMYCAAYLMENGFKIDY